MDICNHPAKGVSDNANSAKAAKKLIESQPKSSGGEVFAGFIILLMIIGFPRFYGTEFPMAFLVLPFYGRYLFKCVRGSSVFLFVLIFLLLGWFFLGCISYFGGQGVAADLFFHFVLFVKICMNIFFGFIVYSILVKSPGSLLLWLIFQCALILLSVLDLGVYNFLLGFISPRSADVFQNIFGLRAVGFGLFHVDGAVLLVSAAFLYILIERSKYIYGVFLVVLFPFAMAMARSAIVPYVIFSVFGKKMAFKFMLVVLFLSMLLLSLFVTSGPFYEALELFRGFLEHGSFSSSSVAATANMFVFDNISTAYVAGHGRYYGESSSELSFYMGTDVGYLRLIYYSGVLSLFLFVVINLYFLIAALLLEAGARYAGLKWFAFGLILVFFVLNGKGIQLSPVFASVIYMMALEGSKNMRYFKLS